VKITEEIVVKIWLSACGQNSIGCWTPTTSDAAIMADIDTDPDSPLHGSIVESLIDTKEAAENLSDKEIFECILYAKIRTMKITDIRVYDFTIYPDSPVYSADIAIDDSFMIQWAPSPDQWAATWSIPHSDEASWNNQISEKQDYAHEHYDAEELAEELGAMEGIQDLIDRKVFED